MQHDCGCGMRGQVNANWVKLTGRGVPYLKNAANQESSGEPRESGVKKPYRASPFRFEPLFDVATLTCSKVFAAQGGF